MPEPSIHPCNKDHVDKDHGDRKDHVGKDRDDHEDHWDTPRRVRGVSEYCPPCLTNLRVRDAPLSQRKAAHRHASAASAAATARRRAPHHASPLAQLDTRRLKRIYNRDARERETYKPHCLCVHYAREPYALETHRKSFDT